MTPIILEAEEAFDRIPAHDQEDTFTITAFGTPDETLNDYIFGTIALPRKEAFESFVNVLRELSERYEQDRNVVVEKLKVNVYTLNKERGGLGRSHNAANSTWKIVDPGKTYVNCFYRCVELALKYDADPGLSIIAIKENTNLKKNLKRLWRRKE